MMEPHRVGIDLGMTGVPLGCWPVEILPLCGLRLALICHRFHGCLDCLRVTEVVVPDRLQVVVEFVHQRLAGGDVEFDDVGVGDVVEILGARR